jgi:DNA-cytosine methyltransferase
MTHLDLFSGIGGFAIAAQEVWPDIAHTFCEIDPFCQAVLRKHWPHEKIHDDIKTLKPRGRYDLLTAGVPCQPASTAGRRQGTEDDRWLWPETFRVIRESRPRWCVLENVRGLLTLGGGVVFEGLCAELEGMGYEIQPFVLPACAIGAPHRRDRIWIIAHATSNRRGKGRTKSTRQLGRTATRIADRVSLNTVCQRIRREKGRDVEWDILHKRQRTKSADTTRGSDRHAPDAESAGRDGSNLSRNDAKNPKYESERDEKRRGDEARSSGGIAGSDTDDANPAGVNVGCRGQETKRYGRKSHREGANKGREQWDENWPEVATRLCGVAHGIPARMAFALRRIEQEYGTPYEKDRRKSMRKVQEALRSPEVQRAFGRLYKIQDTEVLLQALCGIPEDDYEEWSHAESDEIEEKYLREMWELREIRRAPLGRRYNEQQEVEHKNALPFLPYETTLAVAEGWHRVRFAQETDNRDGFQRKGWRNAALKGAGNAIVPAVAVEIFRAIKAVDV